MAATTSTVTRLTHALGAEVSGIDLSRPLTRAQVQEVQELFHEHQVLFFRNQHIDDVAQRDFAAHFGPLQHFAFLPPISEDLPEVHAIDIDLSKPKTANADIWHSDATFLNRPPLGSLLRAVLLPEVGGDTLWASMYAAYEALSSRMQRLIDTMTAVHDSSNSVSHARKAANADHQPVTHPVVRTHPVTGRKALFVNKTFTTRLEGLTERENDTLLPMLTDHVRSPDFQVRFHWQPGSIALWDNRCTQHYAVADYSGRRRMHRVVIDGGAPE
ncbi:TauD/TfdA dioxygenase family protein [Nocardia vermiculata]|uniref:Taurine dioxygenase n=1 Tax=Nocardia vermiculata TaxID=257274 RepID=A0A846XVX6_9NOCA|nr:TauD/TfdA family dioxygenase [Nocardia vermiculata]NKY51286.1 taurine dioxygenase [Nocardia vermiculata]